MLTFIELFQQLSAIGAAATHQFQDWPAFDGAK
jgi:hypothetical protein